MCYGIPSGRQGFLYRWPSNVFEVLEGLHCTSLGRLKLLHVRDITFDHQGFPQSDGPACLHLQALEDLRSLKCTAQSGVPAYSCKCGLLRFSADIAAGIVHFLTVETLKILPVSPLPQQFVYDMFGGHLSLQAAVYNTVTSVKKKLS